MVLAIENSSTSTEHHEVQALPDGCRIRWWSLTHIRLESGNEVRSF